MKVLLFLVIAIMASVVLLRFFSWSHASQRSLLPELSSLATLEDLTVIPDLIRVPSQTFGAELFTAGLFTKPTSEFPEGTIALVYTKNDWRMVEIDYLPNQTAEAYLATHIYPTQEIVLDPEHSAWIQSIDDRPRCIDYEDDVPNRCEISKHLIADLPDHLLIIAVDGDHATDGELIEMARSIISPVDAPIAE